MAFFKRDSKKKPPKSEGRSGNKQLTKVTCDSCGDDCSVPFRPAQGKPVYCNKCFRKESPSRGPRPSRNANNDQGSSSRDLTQINAKLDRILELLEGN
ncbi:hypothetical protein HOH87_01375 [bacterium]|jgi:CxxC-x17-CxxC domain-containing protein|nr:hypothetical protein [bacterium]